MNKCKAIAYLMVCLFILQLAAGCTNGARQPDDATLPATEQDKISSTPVEYVTFSDMQEFRDYIAAADEKEDVADLASLIYYFEPTGLPAGYELYKITAGIVEIGFWYLPEEHLISETAMRSAEAKQLHFMFASPREPINFDDSSYMDRDSSEFSVDGSAGIVTVQWVKNDARLWMYVPKGYEILDAASLCETDMYVKNTDTQVFALVED